MTTHEQQALDAIAEFTRLQPRPCMRISYDGSIPRHSPQGQTSYHYRGGATYNADGSTTMDSADYNDEVKAQEAARKQHAKTHGWKYVLAVGVFFFLWILGGIKFSIDSMPPRHPLTNSHSTYISMPYSALTTVEHEGHRFIVFETTHGVGLILHPDDPAVKAQITP